MQEFETRLQHAFSVLLPEQMVIKMGNRTWAIPIQDLQQNGHLQPSGMEVLQNRLRLQHSDLVFVAVKDPSDIRLLVLSSDGSEKMHFWF